MENITLLIVEEDQDFRTSATDSLDSDPGIERIVQADSLESAEAQVVCHNPDFIVIDQGFQDLEKFVGGFSCRESIPFILVMSYYDNEDYIRLAREAGAHAFCLKKNLAEAVSQLIIYKKKGISESILRNKFYLLN